MNTQLDYSVTLSKFVSYVQQAHTPLVPVYASQHVLQFLATSNALGGEVGELQNIVKKIVKSSSMYSDSELHQKFVLEAGDAMHYLISLVTLAGYSMEYVMACNMQKLDARKAEEFEAQTAVLAKTSAQS